MKAFIAAFLLLSVPVTTYAEHGASLRAVFDSLELGDRFAPLPSSMGAFELVSVTELRGARSYLYGHISGHRFSQVSHHTEFSVEFLEIGMTNGAVRALNYEHCRQFWVGISGTLKHSGEWGFCDDGKFKIGDLRNAQ